MRWSCPHCGTQLAVSDEKLGAGWSFSRCYKCGGFALVRKSEVNLIKVDRAPVGENVLLPEASETPMLSREATNNLEKYSKPTIRPAVRRNSTADAVAQAALANMPAQQPASMAVPPPFPKSMLPEEPPRRLHSRILPAAIGATGILAVSSGVYLYIQGQALWEKTRASARATAAATQSAARPVTVTTAMVTDRVQQRAMAPIRDPEPARGIASFTIRPKTTDATLYAGPGSNYPSVGIANAQAQYTVVDWNERWFRIVPKGPTQAGSNKANETAMWIRNDLVQMIQGP